MPRKEEKPTLGKRLNEWAMTGLVLVLVGGLVCAFVMVGISFLHGRLSRNEDPNLVAREDGGKSAEEVKESALEALKKPLPPPPAPAPGSVAVKPAEVAPPAPAKPVEKPVEKPKEAPKPPVPAPLPPVAPPPPPPNAKIPEGPPSRDVSRMDNEGFIRYWLILAPLPSEKEGAGGVEITSERLPGEANLKPRADERVVFKGKDYTWKRYKSPEYYLDFRKFVEGQRADDALAYAVTYVSCDQEIRDVKVLAGTNDEGRVYINGKLIFSHEKSRSLERDASIANGIVLQKGQNVIILKVANEKGNWAGCLRFMDKNGTPIRHLAITSQFLP